MKPSKSKASTKSSRKRVVEEDDTDTGGVPYVHVINSLDIESHFGKVTNEARKVDVKLKIDAGVWQRTREKAAESDIDISLFVEDALKQLLG